ncbi:hypothetical protein [Sphingomonas sp. R86520]|uniref:hypothetical protein n=1 Tax=Sphingomonas sp. R86520 TaxID=3093859 RepID=UPI0036D2A74B
MQISTGGSHWPGTGTAPLRDVSFSCGPQLACPIIPVNNFIRSADRFSLSCYIQRWLAPAVTGTHYVGFTVAAFGLAGSINFGARKVIFMLGDSTWNGVGAMSMLACAP